MKEPNLLERVHTSRPQTFHRQNRSSFWILAGYSVGFLLHNPKTSNFIFLSNKSGLKEKAKLKIW